MTADSIIEQIRQLPIKEQEKVAEAIADLQVERENDRISSQRFREIREGNEVTLTQKEVVSAVQSKLRET